METIIIQRADSLPADGELINDNIVYTRVPNSEAQHELLLQLAAYFVTGDYRLLIIDSILNLFRSDYIGRGELSERQQKLGLFLRKLAEFATEFNIVILMTNQVQSDPGASALFASADGRKPVGGHVLAHASATRLLLRKGRGEERVAKLMDSPGISDTLQPTHCRNTDLRLQIVQRLRPPTSSPRAASTMSESERRSPPFTIYDHVRAFLLGVAEIYPDLWDPPVFEFAGDVLLSMIPNGDGHV